MDMASSRWFTELGMDDYKFIDQCEINYLASDFTAQNMGSLQQSFSSDESYTSYPTLNTKTNTKSGSTITETSDQTSTEKPTKLQKTNCTPQLLSFDNSATVNIQNFYRNLAGTVKPKDEAVSPGNMQFQPAADPFENQNFGNKRSYSMTRSPAHAQDHIIAERKRREKLSQRFIALSAIVPGLKKMDKASVLGEAIKHVKQLQERVAELEGQTKKKTMESVILVKKSHISAGDESSSCEENSDIGHSDLALPEIEARTSDDDVLIRIHCEKQQGILLKVLNEVENLHLSLINSSVLPFGNSTLDITIIAKMDSEYSMKMKDIVKNLRLAFLKFM